MLGKPREEWLRIKEFISMGEQEWMARKEQEWRAREVQERRAREEQERRAREEQERRAREEQERRAREEQERRAREEERAEEFQRQVAALQDEMQRLREEKEKEIETLKNEKKNLQHLVEEKDKEIELLKTENVELREQWKSEQFKQKKQKFLAKSKEQGWDIAQSSPEDVEYLFEEFEIQDLLKPLSDCGASSFDELMELTVGTAVSLLNVDYFKASKLVFSIELMVNGIYSKEGKAKHLQNCPICKMEVKKGLEEYCPAAEAIAAKFAGMHFGEIKNLTLSECIGMGIERRLSLLLQKAIKAMKDNHSFA